MAVLILVALSPTLQGTLGFGFAVALTPALVLFLEPRDAVALTLLLGAVVSVGLYAGHSPKASLRGVLPIVIGGLVGSGDRVGYTVHGDNVNLTARLEQLNKDYGTRIIVSEQTRALIEPGKYAFRALGEVLVRGRQKPVRIYTIDV